MSGLPYDDLPSIVSALEPGTATAFVGLSREAFASVMVDSAVTHDDFGVVVIDVRASGSVDSILERVVEALRRLAAAAVVSGSVPRRLTALPPAIRAWWSSLASDPQRRPPRGLPLADEIRLYASAMSEGAVALVAEVPPDAPDVAAGTIHAVRWMAEHAGLLGVLLLPTSPARWDPPYDAIAHGALSFAALPSVQAARAGLGGVVDDPVTLPVPRSSAVAEPVVAMVLDTGAVGTYAKGSPCEKAIYDLVQADAELKPLFVFNVPIVLDRPPRSVKPDLLWREGRLVVEIDGYPHHGDELHFHGDRRRDFAFMAQGYLVLRLTNAEVAMDAHAALEKIRVLARMRRPDTHTEAS